MYNTTERQKIPSLDNLSFKVLILIKTITAFFKFTEEKITLPFSKNRYNRIHSHKRTYRNPAA